MPTPVASDKTTNKLHFGFGLYDDIPHVKNNWLDLVLIVRILNKITPTFCYFRLFFIRFRYNTGKCSQVFGCHGDNAYCLM